MWILAGVAAFGAFFVVVPTLLPPPSGVSTPVAKVASTTRPTLTPIPTTTPAPLPPSARISAASPLPTLAPNARVFTYTTETGRTGWYVSGEKDPHWGERNLHSGTYKGQTYSPIMLFELDSLAPGSRILFAELEMTGLSRTNLGASGQWSLKLLPSDFAATWVGRPVSDFQDVKAIGDVGGILGPSDLAEGHVNQFTFPPALLPQIERAVNTNGLLALRLDGPKTEESLFTWDGGDRDQTIGSHPTLRVVAVPGQFTFITNTPTPQNVLTAAANLVQSTQVALRQGTSTPLPRSFATIPPDVVVTPTPTPANPETATVRAAYATAIAITTGTFTPTPLNWVSPTWTPTLPVMIPVLSLTPSPTPTCTPTVLTPLQSAQRPLPRTLYNKILFQSGSRDQPSVWAVDPDGKNLAWVVDRATYDTAVSRDTISPDGQFRVFNGADRDNPGALQLWYASFASPEAWTRLTILRQGFAFAPAWSPDGAKIAYVSNQSGKQEIWVLDLKTRTPKQLTVTPAGFWSQYPSWSPDGKQIAFSSDRGHDGAFSEIWIMNADGSNPVRLGNGKQDTWQPVWVKWKQ